MGRPRIEDGLEQFFDWMMVHGYSPATAKSYTSSARRAVREMGGQAFEEQEAVDGFFLALYESNPVAYPNVLRSWKLMCEWNAEERGIDLAVPRSIQAAKRRADAAKELPPSVRAALRGLRDSAVAVSHIPQLRWCDVILAEMQTTRTHVSVPGKREEWIVPSSFIKTLWEWAAVGTDLSKPLVPREPGSNQAYPYHGLRREIDVYTEKELKEKMGPLGSALGGALPRGTATAPPIPDNPEDLDDMALASDNLLSDLLAFDPNAVD
jgi:hypothetical protein